SRPPLRSLRACAREIPISDSVTGVERFADRVARAPSPHRVRAARLLARAAYPGTRETSLIRLAFHVFEICAQTKLDLVRLRTGLGMSHNDLAELIRLVERFFDLVHSCKRISLAGDAESSPVYLQILDLCRNSFGECF